MVSTVQERVTHCPTGQQDPESRLFSSSCTPEGAICKDTDCAGLGFILSPYVLSLLRPPPFPSATICATRIPVLTTPHLTTLTSPCPLTVPRGWTLWSSWSYCSVSCGGGSQVRTRSCTVSAPPHGSLSCEGPDTQTRHCGQQLCLQKLERCSWGPWGPCSRSCGTGLASRSGSCPCLLTKEDSKCNDTFLGLDTQACYSGPCQGELFPCFSSLENSGNKGLPRPDSLSEMSLFLLHNNLHHSLQSPLWSTLSLP